MFKKNYLLALASATLLFFSGCNEITESIEPGQLSATKVANSNLPAGSQLTHQGGGIWYGSFMGVPVYFQGITPEQIQAGLQSQWYVTAPYYTNDYIVSGTGNQFSVRFSACTTAPLGDFTFPRLEIVDGYVTRKDITRSLPELGNGSCQLEYFAKIIVYNGVPGIYDLSSYVPDGSELTDPTPDPTPTPTPTPVEVMKGGFYKNGVFYDLQTNVSGQIVRVDAYDQYTNMYISVSSFSGHVIKNDDGSMTAFTQITTERGFIKYSGPIYQAAVE